MDSQETPINRKERRRSRRSRAAERVSFWFEDWVLLRGGDALRGLLRLIGRGFEWLAWVLRRGLVWPVQDRAGKLGAPGRAIAALASVLVIAVGVAAVLSIGGGSDSGEPASDQVAVAPEPPAAPAPEVDKTAAPEETLQGAAPVFKPAEGEKAKVETAQPIEKAAPASADPATATIGSGPGAASSSSSASASSASTSAAASATQSSIGVDGPPAGPAAIAVAEDFADAFVDYETGGEEPKVRKAFAATATTELAKSLLKRPPRLPANVEVPKAKVVNVVAGPSHGGVYTVSVSLLRVGLTSELRLDMEKLKNEWRVTNVLG
ncbi:MAG TPA: hypothetical protein VHR18_01385 [Solirubrobacterales bacterium]|jgi:hypothetical protein|nr:hypothetical protein [Solirubrobacterales bacterium]